ncbi:MAG: tetratricopeptide repeat protein [Sulfurimonas sp.]|nr:tetratricopeptide repeat protein [Sulfurimonas sp.]
MAKLEEEIIIIQESDAAIDHELDSTTPELQNDDKKKKIIIFSIIGAILLIIIIISLVFSSSKDKKQTYSLDYIEERLDEDNKKTVELSKLENMIAKANYLYSHGSKEKALNLYEKIAEYSESISLYNLGVAQLKNEQYDTALKTFAKAILNGEKRCVSAINAAVCSLHLKDKKSFDYYIDLAYAYLPQENKSPLYSYYYTLIQYYSNNYLEALSSLNNPTTDAYPNIQKHLKAKINALYGNNYEAIEDLEKDYQKSDAFSVGLLYARVGDLTLAKQYFKDAMRENIEPVKSALALSYIYLKSGLVASAGKLIENTTDMFPEEIYKPYPIKVTLKDELFDSAKAQDSYRENITKDKFTNYHKIFYYSPYKIFDAHKTISYIRKGNSNMFIDNIQSAQTYLNKSTATSTVNKGIVQAIKMALSFNIRDANEKLKELVNIQPKHSILNYNIGLTYAQLGDIAQAHKYFIKSFHLDAKNYLSGIYGVMCAKILDKEHTRLLATIKESISLEQESEYIRFIKTLLYVSDNNTVSALDWLYNDYKQRPIYLALESIIALELNNKDIASRATKALVALSPNDILPHMMYIDAHFNELKQKEYAFEVMNYLKEQKFNFDDLYYGPYITRYLYIQQNLITGRLFFLRKQLRDTLETTHNNTQEIVSSLALASLYDKKYEESYVLYNHLIDDLKVRDSHTLFLGAVASTASSHPANAIALLELAKMKNRKNKESRYALGLLYLETQNNGGAVIQFKQIGDGGFTSRFFNFEIDTQKLYLDKIIANKDNL